MFVITVVQRIEGVLLKAFEGGAVLRWNVKPRGLVIMRSIPSSSCFLPKSLQLCAARTIYLLLLLHYYYYLAILKPSFFLVNILII
jgi:hypothetical protein